jgi:hypothetical protein
VVLDIKLNPPNLALFEPPEPIPTLTPLTNKSFEKVVSPLKVCVPLSKAIVPVALGKV